MRKAQKQEILAMIQILHEAHDEIKNQIDRKNFCVAQDIISQCQECAISIGTTIEKLEGEGFVTVSYAESYCDVLFSAYQELNDSNVNANIIYKNLKKQLLRIENSVKNDVPIRKEVAFFPYKASMWDALESVYLAAKEDPNCDAYCVPIPYYDRNPDGSLGQMHYEGREYPKNIEVIDWQTYHFEERRPDAIYIHNPYDDWNLVTCVHPRYFSTNLKKYTDKLVYIPYFVLDEIEPDDQTKIDSMKHFIWTAGVINADRVIVQSEKMKQIYVNEYLKAAQANGLQGKHIDRKYLEEKFLGLGSPKFDKVLNTKKEDLEIPEKWLKIIEKPDGSWKKIIFYNTSIAALLEHNEKMLEKMKDVFRIFKENKDEVALLWRPHPLIKTTVSAMRPRLWIEYEKLVKQYKEEGWGIYDDSSDIDRAVVLSDGYYGDSSSVVQLYQKTKKPMLLEMPYICGNNKNYQDLEFENLYEDSEYLWFTAFHFNGLFKMDKLNWRPQFVGVFPNEALDGLRLYSTIVEYEDKLFFTPLQAKEIAVYDKNANIFSKISFEELKIEYLDGYTGWNFYDAKLHGDSIYFFPHQRMAVLRYNIKNKELEAIPGWVTAITKEYHLNAPRVYYRTAIKEDIIYAPVSGCNLLEIINLKTGQIKLHEIGKKGSTYSDICISGTKGYICPFDGEEFVEWDLTSGKEMKLLQFSNENAEIIHFQGINKLENKLYAFPEYYEKVIEIDEINEEIIQDSENVFNTDYIDNDKFMNPSYPIESRYTCCYEAFEKIYAYCYTTRRLIEHSKQGNRSKRVAIDYTIEQNREYIEVRRAYISKVFYDRTKIIHEMSSYDLYDFMQCMLMDKDS